MSTIFTPIQGRKTETLVYNVVKFAAENGLVCWRTNSKLNGNFGTLKIAKLRPGATRADQLRRQSKIDIEWKITINAEYGRVKIADLGWLATQRVA